VSATLREQTAPAGVSQLWDRCSSAVSRPPSVDYAVADQVRAAQRSPDAVNKGIIVMVAWPFLDEDLSVDDFQQRTSTVLYMAPIAMAIEQAARTRPGISNGWVDLD